ncbi:MAG: PAS domain S-box protein [Bacteroidales bacterium]|nr:PAS domain S-box protein [Bacteroidales bacterium]
MRFLKNISINYRIQLTVAIFLFILLCAAGFTISQFSAKRVNKSIQNQANTYLNQLSALILEVEKQNGKGFNHSDYASLKPHFSKAAFYETDLPFMVDAQGTYAIHLYKEGQRYPQERLNHLFTNRTGVLEYTDFIKGEKHRIRLFYKKVEPYNSYIALPVSIDEAQKELSGNRALVILIFVVSFTVLLFVIRFTLKPFIATIKKINESISKLSYGETAQKIEYKNNDEVGQIVQSLSQLINGLTKISHFANEIGKNNLSATFEPLGPNDNLGNSLLSVRKNLMLALEDEERRKKEDEKRNWFNIGLAKFADFLRQNNDNLNQLADTVTQNLLDYLNANQGALFVVNQDNDEATLELLSAFAYSKKKFKQKTIPMGEGLVGSCALEKQTIYLKEIPENYIEITSGLGEATPRTLLLVPLKLEDKIFGVIEIATFNEFEAHEVEFVEKIGENIASTLFSVKNSIRTIQLLEQSQQQSEEMAAQEEEMRQNMEEMQATQEEMARKTLEMEGMTSAINEAMLFAELNYEGFMLIANHNMLNLIGFTKIDLEGKTLSNFIHPDSISTFNQVWNGLKTGEVFKGTLKWKTRDNEERFVLCSITPSFEETGEIYKIFLLGQDVTESKRIEIKAQEQAEEIEQILVEMQAEQEVSEQRQEKMDELLQALDKTCLITEIDPSGTINFINNRNTEVLGDEKDNIEGRLHSELDSEAKTNPDAYRKFWNDLLSGLPQKRNFSLKVKGSDVWISEHYTPIINDQGEVVKIINIGIDISDSKLIERKLQKQIDELIAQLKKK